MRIAVVHNRVGDDEGPDAGDVLTQAEVVCEALARLGHRVEVFACSLNLEQAAAHLRETESELIFNLVESLGGYGRLIPLFPSLLEAMGLAYTGSSAASIGLTSNKTEAKEILRKASLPTPGWFGPLPAHGEDVGGDRPWIIKSLWEHASLGMDEQALVRPAWSGELVDILRQRASRLGGACFAEHFIDGREFNISLLAGENGPEVLPPAEIIFEGFTPDMVRIVDYSAKWDATSFVYQHTRRSFESAEEDRRLFEHLKELAASCWHLFSLNGYARVDFRVDADGNPWILEVNANPCLSPDAGFAAAVARAGISFDEAVRRILNDLSLTCC